MFSTAQLILVSKCEQLACLNSRLPSSGDSSFDIQGIHEHTKTQLWPPRESFESVSVFISVR